MYREFPSLPSSSSPSGPNQGCRLKPSSLFSPKAMARRTRRSRLAIYSGDPEALRERTYMDLCRCLFALPIIAFFIWLTVYLGLGQTPNFSLQRIYLPCLNTTLNSPKKTTLIFTLKVENRNYDMGVYYDPINVTFFDAQNESHLIGNFTFPKFYQGQGKTAIKDGQIEASGLHREAAARAVSVNGSAVYRVDLATSVRYHEFLWKAKRHAIKLGANVQVNDISRDHKQPQEGCKAFSSS